MRLGVDVCEYLGVSRGDFVEVMFDVGRGVIGFRRSEVEGVGFRASGRHLSMTLSFATPKNRFSKLLLSVDGRELPFRGEDGVAVVEVGVC